MVHGENVQGLPGGFEWGAVKAGIKASGKLDLAVAVAPKMASAAAMFTKNQVVAAPVTVGRRHLHATGGRVGGGAGECGECQLRYGAAGDRCMRGYVCGGGGGVWVHLRRGDAVFDRDYWRAIS